MRRLAPSCLRAQVPPSTELVVQEVHEVRITGASPRESWTFTCAPSWSVSVTSERSRHRPGAAMGVRVVGLLCGDRLHRRRAGGALLRWVSWWPAPCSGRTAASRGRLAFGHDPRARPGSRHVTVTALPLHEPRRLAKNMSSCAPSAAGSSCEGPVLAAPARRTATRACRPVRLDAARRWLGLLGSTTW